jgi:hypothetical protein
MNVHGRLGIKKTNRRLAADGWILSIEKSAERLSSNPLNNFHQVVVVIDQSIQQSAERLSSNPLNNFH